MAKKHDNEVRPTVDVARPDYQPSKAELEADMRIDSTPEDIAKALVRPVNIRFVRRPKGNR